MEPIMSCPQGLTLSGKMCTIAPILSCPSGYTLVNGMCQQDDGLQGFGYSMNIPPSGVNPIGAGEFGDQQPVQPVQEVQPSPQVTSSSNWLKNLTSDVGDMVAQKFNVPMQGMPQPMSPMSMMRLPSQQAPPSPTNIASRRPSSPTRIQTQTMNPTQPLQPPPRTNSPPPAVRNLPSTPPPPPPSGSPLPRSPCPAGYSLSSADGLCYPLNNFNM